MNLGLKKCAVNGAGWLVNVKNIEMKCKKLKIIQCDNKSRE